VVIPAVDDRDANVGALQRLRGVETAESRAYDDDLRSIVHAYPDGLRVEAE